MLKNNLKNEKQGDFPFLSVMFLSVYRWYRKLEETIPQDSFFLCMPCSLPRYVRPPENDVVRWHTACNEVPAGRYKQGTISVRKRKEKIRIGPYFVPLSSTLPVYIAIKSLYVISLWKPVKKQGKRENLQKKTLTFFLESLIKSKPLQKHYAIKDL